MPKYTYTAITTQPDLGEIHTEVANSAMADKSIVWARWDEDEQEINVQFSGTLSGGDKTILDSIISALGNQDTTIPNYNSVYAYSFVSKNNEGLLGNSSTYSIEARIVWEGRKYIGYPIEMKALIKTDSSLSWIKIYDITNSKTIVESSFSNSQFSIIDLGTISDISEEEAIWEIQLKNTNNNDSAILSSISLRL